MLLLAMLLLSLAFAAPRMALADADDHTRDEAVAYLNSLVGEECCWNDSTTDCVDVVQYYYDWLEVGARSGNGCAYHTGNQPDGWERVYSDPEPGDVAAWGADWGSSGVGHVACVVGVDDGTITVVEQSTTKRKKAGHNVACYYATYSISSPYSYLRPNFRGIDHDPLVMVDGCSGGDGTVSVSGWAFDPDEPESSLWINVYVGAPYGDPGTWGHGDIRADLESADVNAAYGVSGAHRFAATFDVPMEGDQPVYVYALNVGEGTHRVYGPIDVRIGKGHGNVPDGWLDLGGGRKGYRRGGDLVKGWMDLDGQKHYFRDSGNMATGFVTLPDGTKRYFDEGGHMLVGWQVIGGRTFYFRVSGAMQTGKATIDGKDYEFTENGTLKSGAMAAQFDGAEDLDAEGLEDFSAVNDAVEDDVVEL